MTKSWAFASRGDKKGGKWRSKCYVWAGAYSEPEGVGENFTWIKNWSLGTKATFMFYDPSHFLGKPLPLHESLVSNLIKRKDDNVNFLS